MRILRLLRVAAEAEALRLRYQAKRAFTRLVFGYFAIVLGFGALAFGHVAAWYWLREHLEGQYVALIFAGVDLLLAIVLALLAARSSPARLELEALDVRRRALEDAAGSLSLMSMMVSAFEFLMSARDRK